MQQHLPRQARNKHRENSKKEWRFLRERTTGSGRQSASGKKSSGTDLFQSAIYTALLKASLIILPRQAQDKHREDSCLYIIGKTQPKKNTHRLSREQSWLALTCQKEMQACADTGE
jgi:hypothetical protein